MLGSAVPVVTGYIAIGIYLEVYPKLRGIVHHPQKQNHLQEKNATKIIAPELLLQRCLNTSNTEGLHRDANAIHGKWQVDPNDFQHVPSQNVVFNMF